MAMGSLQPSSPLMTLAVLCHSNFLSWNPLIWFKCHGSHLRMRHTSQMCLHMFGKHLITDIFKYKLLQAYFCWSQQLSRLDVPCVSKVMCTCDLHDFVWQKFNLFTIIYNLWSLIWKNCFSVDHLQVRKKEQSNCMQEKQNERIKKI